MSELSFFLATVVAGLSGGQCQSTSLVQTDTSQHLSDGFPSIVIPLYLLNGRMLAEHVGRHLVQGITVDPRLHRAPCVVVDS